MRAPQNSHHPHKHITLDWEQGNGCDICNHLEKKTPMQFVWTPDTSQKSDFKINAHHQFIPLFLTSALTMASAPSLTVPQPLQRMQSKRNCSCIPERYHPKTLRRAYLRTHSTGLRDGKWLKSSQRQVADGTLARNGCFSPPAVASEHKDHLWSSLTSVPEPGIPAPRPKDGIRASSCVTPAIDWN